MERRADGNLNNSYFQKCAGSSNYDVNLVKIASEEKIPAHLKLCITAPQFTRIQNRLLAFGNKNKMNTVLCKKFPNLYP